MASGASETLLGTAGANVIRGLGGDDRIFGHQAANAKADAGAIHAVRIAKNLDGAVFAGAAPGDPDGLYVLQKNSGIIRRIDLDTGDRTTVLNIPDGDLAGGNEQGALGLAFHPDYASNGRFYVHLTRPGGDIEVREYTRAGGSGPPVADPDSGRTIIVVPHGDATNHNGGAIAFGPDGCLYVAIGDGGGGFDPDNNAQNLNVLLGKILRLDVDGDDFGGDDERNYAIPDDNPFVGEPGADEIWAYGLRNPWRMAFDTETGDLYIGDVGQQKREEVNFQPAGEGGVNYGWVVREGTLGPTLPGAVDPIFEYSHKFGIAVTGGYVFRGPGEALKGHYFFADFGSGRLWTLKVVDGVATGVVERTTQIETSAGKFELISSFGLDSTGRLYAVTLSGDIFRLDLTALSGDRGDRLFGGPGDDKLYGGAGDDRLFGEGDHDGMRGGFGDDRLVGGAGRDALFGDAGDDRLEGSAGGDAMTGGKGRDIFIFGAGLKQTGRDVIADFSPKADTIRLERDVYKAIGAELTANEFRRGHDAADADDRIVYRPNEGLLLYDANGSKGGGVTRIALLDPRLPIDHTHFDMA